tara:strand:+ start:571 stop:1320 length:750 start_codon:yes stop_codon:yes gene_type:complete
MDIRIIRLRSTLGYAGYGVFWAVLEVLFSEENKLCLEDYETLAYGLQCDVDILKKVIEDFDLFVIEDGCFYSKRLMKTIEDINERSLKASNNAKKRWDNAIAKPSQSPLNAIKVNKSKLEQIKEKKIKEDKIKKDIAEFNNSVHSQEGFEKEDKEEFFLYWSELNKSGTKQRFQLEKTWNLKRRLQRWCSNNFSKNNKDKFPDFWDKEFSRKLQDENKRSEYYLHLKSLGWTSVYSPNAGMVWNKKKQR